VRVFIINGIYATIMARDILLWKLMMFIMSPGSPMNMNNMNNRTSYTYHRLCHEPSALSIAMPKTRVLFSS